MDLASIVSVLRRYARSIAAVLLVGLALGVGAFVTQRPLYTSTGALFFTVNPEAVRQVPLPTMLPGREDAGDMRLQREAEAASSRAKTYQFLAQTPAILDPAAKRVGVPMSGTDLAGHVAVIANEGTAELTVTAKADTPQLAAAMADAVLQEVVASFDFYATGGANPGVGVKIVQPPQVPSAPSSPGLVRNLALGGVLGLVAALTQAFVRARTSRRLRTPADAVLATPVPLIAEIPLDRNFAGRVDAVGADPFAPRVEAIRRLRTNLDFFADAHDAGPWLITSALPGEGKTSTAIGLAQSFADAGRSVVLVDADLRRPQVASALALDTREGLAETLASGSDACSRVLSAGAFDVLPAGEPPRNPAELLSGPRMAAVLTRLGELYDTVIIDSAPVLPAADTIGLSRISGPVVLVAASGGVRRGQLQKAIQSLTNVDADLAGVVLNKITSSSAGVYGGDDRSAYAPRRAIRSELAA